MSKLFQAGKIGTLEIPNRIVRSATAERLAEKSLGYPKHALGEMWENLSRGGTGLIITGHMYIHPSGKCHPEMTSICDDGVISRLEAMVERVHESGAKIAVQINHGGMQCSKETVQETIAPSAMNTDFLAQNAREITIDEIWMLVDAYGKAARRVREAGFDAVQLHGAHGYLINQFLSPYTNCRNDEWGGDFPKRLRFLREITKAVKNEVGEKYPILIKLGMVDGVQGGLDIEDGTRIVAAIADMGIDGIEVSGGIQASNSKKGINTLEKEAYFRHLARSAKQVTDLPVILVGGIRSKIIMDELLDSGDADFVSLCRPLIHDPEFPNLLKAGTQIVSGCISSNNCWPSEMGEGISCKCPV